MTSFFFQPPDVDLDQLSDLTDNLSSVAGGAWMYGFNPPEHPYLVEEAPEPGQMTIGAFLTRVATLAAAKHPKLFANETALVGLASAQLLGPFVAALGGLGTVEAALRHAMEMHPHAQLDAEEQAQALSTLMSLYFGLWESDADNDPDSYTDDDVKSAQLASVLTAGMMIGPQTFSQFCAGFSTKMPPNTVKSTTAVGRRIHRFVQGIYLIMHPKDVVVCDGRWYAAQVAPTVARATATVSAVIHNASLPQHLAYQQKISTYAAAMRCQGYVVRPDIVNLSRDHMYEIKSRLQSKVGAKELFAYYLEYYNRMRQPPILPMAAGDWVVPPFFPDLTEMRLVTLVNDHGVIIYDIYPLDPQTIKAIGTLLVMIAIASILLRSIAEKLKSWRPDPADRELVLAFVEGLRKTILYILLALIAAAAAAAAAPFAIL